MIEIATDLVCGSQDEPSEMFIGEWAEARAIRDQLIIATKASPWSLVGW